MSPANESQIPATGTPSWEQPRIGLTTASLLVVGNMIGAGVFTTSGFSLADLGAPRWVMLAWLIGGGIALCGALCYAGLAHRIPKSGGEYRFLSDAVHPALGFCAGWVSLLAGFTAPIAAAALTFDAYLRAIVDIPIETRWIGSAVIIAAGLAHGVRVSHGVTGLNTTVVAKLVGILAFLLFGASAMAGRPLPESPPVALDWRSLGVTLVWISFAYSGWNGAIYLASEIRDPERNLRRSLWVPTIAVTALYLALNALLVWSAPYEALSGRPDIAAVAAQSLGGPGLARAVSLLVALALVTSIVAMVMVGPRVYAQMARDGLLPAAIARGTEAPTAAVTLQVGLALVALWSASLRQLLGYVGFTLSLSATATVLSAAWLRWHEGHERVPIAGFPLTPILFCVFSLGSASMLALAEPKQAAIGLATATIGLPLYFIARRNAES